MTLTRTTIATGTTVITGSPTEIITAVRERGILSTVLPDDVVAEVSGPPVPPIAPPAPTAPPNLPMTFTRPNGEIFYARRIVWGDQETTDVQLIRDWVTAGLYAFLVGAAGTGKTALIEAALWNWEGCNGLETLVGTSSTEPVDFLGGHVPRPGGVFEWKWGPQARAMMGGKILYVDEIALIDPDVLPVLYPVMDGRDRIATDNPDFEEIRAEQGFHVIASTNPDAPGAVMADALISRFAPPIVYHTDFTIAVRNLGVPVEAAALARDMTKALRAGTAYWAPTMRDLIQFTRIEKVSGRKAAWHGLLTAAPVEARPEVSLRITDATGIILNGGWEIG